MPKTTKKTASWNFLTITAKSCLALAFPKNSHLYFAMAQWQQKEWGKPIFSLLPVAFNLVVKAPCKKAIALGMSPHPQNWGLTLISCVWGVCSNCYTTGKMARLQEPEPHFRRRTSWAEFLLEGMLIISFNNCQAVVAEWMHTVPKALNKIHWGEDLQIYLHFSDFSAGQFQALTSWFGSQLSPFCKGNLGIWRRAPRSRCQNTGAARINFKAPKSLLNLTCICEPFQIWNQ